LHILFLTDNFPPEVNAPASRTFEHCREWVKAGHRVTVVTCAPNFPKGLVYPGYRNKLWQREVMDGIRVVRVWSYITANEGFLKRILDYQSFMMASVLASHFVRKVDIVVGTSPHLFTACAAYVVGLLKRIPFVFELRDLWPESIKAVGAMQDSLVMRCLERVELFLYRQASAIVSTTHSFRFNLAQRGIDQEKISVVTNGVDTSRFHLHAKDGELLAGLGLNDKFVVGYIGTHGLAHGLETLLEAARVIQQQPGGKDVHFLFLGDGARKAILKHRAGTDLDNILFIDSVPKEQVVRYYALLDASIIHLKKTDLFTKVIPSKLFESIGMGIPVLHGVAGESADIVQREGIGLVFEPENVKQLCERVLMVKQDRALYNALREACLQAAAKYERSELAKRMLSVLEATVARRSEDASRKGLLFINRYFYPDQSATSQLLTELAEDLQAEGRSVTVIAGRTLYYKENRKLPAYEVHKGIRIVRVGFIRFNRARMLGRLADYLSFWTSAFWQTIRMSNFSCIVALSDPPLLCLLAAMVNWFRPIKTICWLQDVFPEIAVKAGVLRVGVVTRILRKLATWSLKKMDHIVVIGNCMKRELCRRGLSSSNVVAISNWADGHYIRPMPRIDNPFLTRHGLQDKFVAMYSGNHGTVHDHETFINLIRETKSCPNFCFCFIGDGAWRARLVELSRTEAWSHVMFLPYQNREMLRSSLTAADIQLVSLRNGMEELSIPSKIYGALAAGKPVLYIGPPESEPAIIIREAQCGYSVVPGDTAGAVKALLGLHRDRTLLEKQGRSAREYFDRHCDRKLSTERFRQILNLTCRQSSSVVQVRTSPPALRR